MASNEIRVPMNRVKAKYNILEHIEDVLGLVEIATSKDNYFKVYDLNIESEAFQFNYILKKHLERPWEKATKCQAIFMKDELANIIPK